jgi:hypothetical protein
LVLNIITFEIEFFPGTKIEERGIEIKSIV